MHTCRVCGICSTNLVKYSTRHHVHADCAMQKWGSAFFDRLTPWQATHFPYRAAQRAGHLDVLIAKASAYPVLAAAIAAKAARDAA